MSFLDKIKYYWHVSTDKYFIQVDYVERQPGKVPVSLEKQYIIYNDKDGSMDYSNDPHKATCFGFVLGGLVVRELRKKCQDLPNLDFGLVSCTDAILVNTIQTGAKSNFEGPTKGPIDFAVEEIAPELMKVPGVNGVGTVTVLNTKKQEFSSFIGISVNDEATKAEIEKRYPNSMYKNFPVKIGIEEKPKA